MATQITANQITSELGPRQTIGGRLAANRQLRGVAIIGALVLALAASLALGRALQSDQARSAVSLSGVGDGPGFTVYREDHRPSATFAEPGFASFREDHGVPVAVPARGFTDYREDHRSDGASTLPGFTDYREDHRP